MCKHHKSIFPRASRREFLSGATGSLLLTGFPLSLLSGPAQAKFISLPAPDPNDTCPVCGMFVAKYPDWIATVLFKDGYADHFDGAKDMFKYLANMKKYGQNRPSEDIAQIGVTDYYTTERIDAYSAVYVIGSDVLGPMGHELVPHNSKADAQEFSADHEAKRSVMFRDVSQNILAGLDKGQF